MSKSVLILVNGESGTGKTTVGKKLAGELGVVFLSRDEIKEAVFDELGVKDREWSHQVGLAAYGVMYYVLERVLEVGESVVVESTFKPREQRREELEGLVEKYGVGVVEVYLWAEKEVLVDRFEQRVASRDRHPGHVDGGNLEEFLGVLENKPHKALDLSENKVEVETSNLGEVDWGGLENRVKELVEREKSG